ncbi:hypothetical protein JA1_005079 [Spathaspora sp. JA1]|nr:hypothetical protein JA1_005079 [Spathaspora sp. JA1]
MTFVNTKQQKLIEESVANHVKFYDKTISQYLKLRQEIYSLSCNLGPSSTPDLTLFQIKYELDKIQHIYQLHLQELTNLIVPNNNTPTNEITQQYESLLEKQTLLSEQISNIKTIQQPILFKIMSLVKSFESNIQSRYISPRTIRDQKKTDSTIDLQSLVISLDELTTMIQEINYIDIDVVNSRIFEKFSDDEVLYKLNKSNLRELTSDMTVADYEELIESTIDQINTLKQEGDVLETNWNNNANKIELIKQALSSI